MEFPSSWMFRIHSKQIYEFTQWYSWNNLLGKNNRDTFSKCWTSLYEFLGELNLNKYTKSLNLLIYLFQRSSSQKIKFWTKLNISFFFLQPQHYITRNVMTMLHYMKCTVTSNCVYYPDSSWRHRTCFILTLQMFTWI